MTETKTKSAGEESLQPQEHRIMGNVSYLFAWLGGCVSIGTFAMGSSLIGTLNLTQAILAMFIGCFIISLGITINGKAGHKYGIPFTVQARSAFGFSGTKISGFIRAFPAIVWFGFQSWIGAGALNEVSKTLIGYDNIIFYFIAFQFLQIALSLLGFKGIKWLENIGSVFIIAALSYMLYSVVNKYGTVITNEIVNIEGTWGWPFWAGATSFLGIYSTMILNASDYSRELVKRTRQPMICVIYNAAILPATLFMGLIGLIVSGATGSADPISVFSSAVDNQVLLIITLLFITFAQVTTNVLNNIIPPVYVLMDSMNLSFKKSVVIIGLLSFGTFPWELVQPESADGLRYFVLGYSMFLGPIFGIMFTDFYLLRKGKLSVDALYDAAGPFRGINPLALTSLAGGALCGYFFLDISWFIGFGVSAVAYYFLMKTQASRFRAGTVFEEKGYRGEQREEKREEQTENAAG